MGHHAVLRHLFKPLDRTVLEDHQLFEHVQARASAVRRNQRAQISRTFPSRRIVGRVLWADLENPPPKKKQNTGGIRISAPPTSRETCASGCIYSTLGAGRHSAVPWTWKK